MDCRKEERSKSTDCTGPTEDGGLSSDLTSLVVMLMKALCAEEPCVAYETELGRLLTATCYMGAKKPRNHFLKQRFAVRLCSCQLKADHGLPKDFKDKITSTHTKNAVCLEFLWRVTKALQSQLWVGCTGLPIVLPVKYGFLPASISTSKRRDVWNGLVSIAGVPTARLCMRSLCPGTTRLDLHHIAAQKLRVVPRVRPKFLDQAGRAFLKAARGEWGGKG